MPPTTVSRAVLRQSRFLTRRTAIRHNSSSSQAANKARETAQSTVSKASEGLSRVTSTAGPVIANAAQNIGSALRKIGGPAGRVISFVDRMIPPAIYYSKVGFELSRLVFRGQNMYPPDLATFRSYFTPLINALRNPSTLSNSIGSPQAIINRVRNLSNKELALIGVTAAEVLGFFTVGEIIGRRHLVGYRGEPEHAHGH
ncbi:hypothetical protein VTN49DRAFT_2791 [Thermomyces lanuginosus]|uniref:uncharacterized protein n=1 Tax=Thermomyces lanuginosus TaxID=5541 RepID=UPI003741FB1B